LGEEVVSDQELKIPPAGPASPEVPLMKEVTPVFKVAPPISAPPEEGFVDFAAELERELEEDAEAQQRALEELARSQMAPPTLNEILQEFQKGVRQTLEEKDFETHYNLGIAYKDMDLLEEAIEEFKLASRDPALTFDCSQLIGLCFMKMGAVDSAIEEFLKGLSVPDQRPEQYRGLKYELALAYEASDNVRNAIDLYSDIFREDPDFRDVAGKVRLLSTGQPQPSEKREEVAPTEEEPGLPSAKTPEETEKPPSPKPRPRKVDYI
jgi:tetratricopeptide (TPR) repeat protein